MGTNDTCVLLEPKILGLSVKLIWVILILTDFFTKILEFYFISLPEGKLLMVKEQNNGN